MATAQIVVLVWSETDLPYEFLRFGAMDCIFPYEFLGFGVIQLMIAPQLDRSLNPFGQM